MSASDFEDDDEWKPPSAAEQKVIAAKRERSDKISKRMGDYLLKGYKMLATNCRLCYTIELQDKQGQIYCVACQEIDCHETSKDDPVLSEEAAGQVIAESAFKESPVSQPSAVTSSVFQQPAPPPRVLASSSMSGVVDGATALSRAGTFPLTCTTSLSSVVMNGTSSQTSSAPYSLQTVLPVSLASRPVATPRAEQPGARLCADANDIIHSTRSVLLAKLNWANQRLEAEQRPEAAIHLVQLIREILTAVQAAEATTL